MAALKLLETRRRRDQFVLLFISIFLIMSSLLREQYLHKALLVVVGATGGGKLACCVLNRPSATIVEFDSTPGKPRRHLPFCAILPRSLFVALTNFIRHISSFGDAFFDFNL